MTNSNSLDFDRGVAPIVVGVSRSPYSLAALRWAAAEAEYRHAPLHAVMAWRDPRPAAAPAGRPPGVLYGSAKELQAEAATALDQAVTEVLGDTQQARLSVVRGSPVDVLLAATVGAQMLVLGASERVGIGALRGRMRSLPISDQISCPVVLVPRWTEAKFRSHAGDPAKAGPG